MASWDRLWRYNLKVCFSGLFTCTQQGLIWGGPTPRSVTILTVCLCVLSCFLFILPLLISPCPHFWTEFMASWDRLWRYNLKACFSGLFTRTQQGLIRGGPTPRSVTILTLSLKYLREPRKRYRLPYVVCSYSSGYYQEDFASHLFLYKNIFVALSLTGVVFIRGLSEDTTEDGLFNYLKNTRRLGGGPVEELKITGNSARVKFESAKGIK